MRQFAPRTSVNSTQAMSCRPRSGYRAESNYNAECFRRETSLWSNGERWGRRFRMKCAAVPRDRPHSTCRIDLGSLRFLGAGRRGHRQQARHRQTSRREYIYAPGMLAVRAAEQSGRIQQVSRSKSAIWTMDAMCGRRMSLDDLGLRALQGVLRPLFLLVC